jgi:bromodomain adjacent to zinc finger domain protein 1A
MSVDDAAPTNGRGTTKGLPGDDGDSELSGLSGDDDDDGASRAPPKSEADDGQSEMADESRIESEMDDMSETASISSRPARPMGSLAIRQQALKAQQQAKEAEAAARAARIAEHRAEVKAKTATSKQLSQERRRLEDEDARLAKREEALHRDFRKQINLPRAKPLGVDRFGNKVWWFDGMGSASLIGPGGVILYGTGRLFLQGADPRTRSFWGQKSEYREDEILKRRLAEEGEEGMLKEGEWVVYEDPAEVRRPPLPAPACPVCPPLTSNLCLASRLPSTSTG